MDDLIHPYPKGVYFSMASEVAERFCYYGVLMILTFFLRDHLGLFDSEAKLWLHAFVAVSNLTPVLGSICSDMWFGPYKVVCWVSVVYMFGAVMTLLGAVEYGSHLLTLLLAVGGILLIACASGCRKPCAAAFAADQFGPDMKEQRQTFFSYFYLAISLGMVLSQFAIPSLRGGLRCFGRDTCYPLAFAVCAGAMLLATLLFFAGTRLYSRHFERNDVILKVCRCMWSQLSAKMPKIYTWRRKSIDLSTSGSASKSIGSKFRESDDDDDDQNFAVEVQRLLDVGKLFLPSIVYWALYDQMFSTWLIQTDGMDGRIGALNVLPEHLATFYSLMLIVAIPGMDLLGYPLARKLGLLSTPLQKMGFGLCLAGVSFGMSGFLQIWIDATVAESTGVDTCTSIFVNTANESHFQQLSTSSGFAVDKERCDLLEILWEDSQASISYNFSKTKAKTGYAQVYIFADAALHSKYDQVNILTYYDKENVLGKLKVGSSNLSLIEHQLKFPLVLKDNKLELVLELCHSEGDACEVHRLGHYLSGHGASDAIIVSRNKNLTIVPLIGPHSVNLLWQLPQYLVMAVSEATFAVAGMEFAYSQAAPSLKSVMQAVWLMNGMTGNLLAMITSALNIFPNAVVDLFSYTTAMFLCFFLFVHMARKYRYKEAAENETK